jgi:hypothetical protein
MSRVVFIVAAIVAAVAAFGSSVPFVEPVPAALALIAIGLAL